MKTESFEDGGVLDAPLSPAIGSLHLLQVGQLPGLFEELWLRSVNSEDQLEAMFRVGGHPVGFMAGPRVGAAVDDSGAVGFLLHVGAAGGSAGVGHVADEGVGLAVVGGDGPVLLDRRVCGD